MKQSESVYSSVLDIGTLKQAVRAAVGNAEISPVQFDALDDPPDFAVLVEKQGFIGGASAIQVHVSDDGERRLVALIALGDSGFARAWNGARNTVSFSGSQKLAAAVADAIRQHDSALQQVG
ncbi:hypothetical protein [Microbacterium karelineae]|uniref:hypothetical protein n=1 Tax=Microbacterium karelineae TaxID=2654283 RepID=UPI0012EA13A4|nr:hypothetical protein [Microbacterium karelineae]